MSNQIDGRKLGRATPHRMAMYRNIVTDLLQYERVITTEAKAKEVRRFADKVITLGKKGDLSSRRRALGFVYNKKMVDKLFGELAERYAGRPGGYTRVTKLEPRMGDGAKMAQLELVEVEEV